jgi:hypothetical protein
LGGGVGWSRGFTQTENGLGAMLAGARRHVTAASGRAGCPFEESTGRAAEGSISPWPGGRGLVLRHARPERPTLRAERRSARSRGLRDRRGLRRRRDIGHSTAAGAGEQRVRGRHRELTEAFRPWVDPRAERRESGRAERRSQAAEIPPCADLLEAWPATAGRDRTRQSASLSSRGQAGELPSEAERRPLLELQGSQNFSSPDPHPGAAPAP